MNGYIGRHAQNLPAELWGRERLPMLERLGEHFDGIAEPSISVIDQHWHIEFDGLRICDQQLLLFHRTAVEKLDDAR